MKFLASIIVSLIASISSFNAQAAGTLKLAKEFNLIAINGEEYQSGLFGGHSNIKLRTGINRLVIEFEEVYEGEDDDDFDVIKSGSFLLQFSASANAKLSQSILKPKNADAAKRFIKNPVFTIKDSQSKTVVHSISPLQSDKLSFAVSKTKPRQNAAIDLSYPSTKKSKITAPLKTGNAANKSRALNMLIYWWSQASEEDKKDFKEAISEQ